MTPADIAALRKELERFQANCIAQAADSQKRNFPFTAVRFEGAADAFATALALLDGAIAPTSLLPRPL